MGAILMSTMQPGLIASHQHFAHCRFRQPKRVLATSDLCLIKYSDKA
jgi:hypothetical protein